MSADVESFKYLVELGLAVQDQSSFYWNFLVVGQIAVVGWVFERGSTFRYAYRITIAVIFSIFLIMNFWGLMSSNSQKDIILSSAQTLSEKPSVVKAFPEEFIKGVKNTPPSYWYPYKFWLIWVPSNVVVLLIILFPLNRMKLNNPSKKDAQKARASS